MPSSPQSPIHADVLAEIQQSFVEAHPRIEGLARAYLGSQRRDDDAVAETVALTWKAYQELAVQGRDTVKLLGKIVEFAAKKVRSGGRLVGMQPVNDVMSATARFRHRHRINSLPLSDEPTATEVLDALTDRSSPADEATFHADLEEWLGGLDGRRREIVEQLVEGHNTVEVARIHRVSRMRIFQLRQGLIEEWERFSGGAEHPPAPQM